MFFFDCNEGWTTIGCAYYDYLYEDGVLASCGAIVMVIIKDFLHLGNLNY